MPSVVIRNVVVRRMTVVRQNLSGRWQHWGRQFGSGDGISFIIMQFIPCDWQTTIVSIALTQCQCRAGK